MTRAGRTALVLDFGERRIGVAIANADAGTASGIDTLAGGGSEPDWQGLDRLIADWQPDQLVMGLPYNADGSDSPMTERVRAIAARLQERYELAVDLVDERLTSVEAENRLREAREQGLRRRRTRREDIDRIAAQVIAEAWLNAGA